MTNAILLMALFAGVALATYFVVRSPAFWVGFLVEVAKGVAPVVTKRMTPEQERAWHECERRGGKWNHLKKRCE